MSNVIQFPSNRLNIAKQIKAFYRVEDPGLTFYAQNEIISDLQIKNDAKMLNCSVEDIFEEMRVTKLNYPHIS